MADRIAYSHEGLPLTGQLYRPDGQAKAAVLVIPTIAGPNPPIFRRAEMLADLGYIAFVADYYGRDWTDFAGMDEIRQAADALKADPRIYRNRFHAALEAFRTLPEAQGVKMAMVGYCMGGQVVCELARDGVKLACGVSFHGDLATALPAEAGAVHTPLLLCHGHLDPLVPPALVARFQAEMDAAGADWTMQIYSHARHGFTDPEIDRRGIAAVAYNKSADHQSWDAMRSFFRLHLDP